MTNIKRVISLILIMLFMLTNVFSTFAYESAGDWNGSGSGDYTGTSDPESISVIHLYHENQGFRCYIVNEYGVNVSNTVDIVKYLPWNLKSLRDYQEGSYLDTYFNRTGIWMNPGGNEYKTMHYLSGVKTDSKYMWSTTTDGKTSRIFRDGRNPLSDPNTSTVGVGTIVRKDYSDPNMKLNEGNIEFTSNAKMYTVDTLTKAINENILELYFPDLQFRFQPGNNTQLPYTNYLGEQVNILAKIPVAIESINGHLVLTGDYMKNLMTYNPNGPDDPNIIIQYIVNMYMPNVDGLGNAKNGGELVPVFEFVDKNLKEQYDKELANYNALSQEEKNSRVNPMITVMQNNKLKLAFEPVSWGVPVVVSNLPTPVKNRWNYYWTDECVIYGTLNNITQYVNWKLEAFQKREDMQASLPDIDLWRTNRIEWYNKYNFNLGWQWGYPQKSYYITNDIPEYNMQAYPYGGDTDNYSLSYFLSTLNTVGWGGMYFSPSLPDITFTTTWDKVKYPNDSYQPAPAPDKSSVSTEGTEYKNVTYPDGKVKDKNFNIVKFYATKKPDGSYEYTENFTRQQTLHKIILDDEPGYTIDNWFTSPEFREPQSDSDSYEDFKNELINGEQHGTSAGRIEVKAESPDKTLYMRLVSNEEPEPEGSGDTITIPLYQNEISKRVSLSSILNSSDLKVTNTIPKVPSNKYSGGEPRYKYRPSILGGANGWKVTYNYDNSPLTDADSQVVAKPAPFETTYSGLEKTGLTCES